MPKQHLYVLVYLVTVMHSMQAGYMNKAQEYTDKALAQIEKLKGKNYLELDFDNLLVSNYFILIIHVKYLELILFQYLTTNLFYRFFN